MSQDKPVRLAGRTLDRSRHVCAFFNSKGEEMLRELRERAGHASG
jgi:hypothetical protein